MNLAVTIFKYLTVWNKL